MLFVQGLVVVSLAACSFARSLPQRLDSRQDGPPTTICGDIIDAVNSGSQIFWASDAYKCLTSVPFNPAVATRFIKYWNETIQFQSTLAYLKNPPEGYQQPAVDVIAELERIQQRVDASSYSNQYDFEADFQLLVYALHDGHVSLTAGILSAFSFASPYEIASVSIDGKQEPKIYITTDVIDSPIQGWTPSPITSINGTEVNAFLTHYAALNSWGYVEPHAEWNALMSHPTLDIQGGLTTFSGSGNFYPGENLTFTFENGTKVDTIWVAIYNELANYTGPLTTGGDFYNYFVLGLLPESFDPAAIVNSPFSDDPVEAPKSWSNDSYGAFPNNPSVAQSDLGIFHGGFVTGYFYDDISTGVLSLPTFDILADTTGNYSQAISEFVGNASDKGLKRIVIDLQRNSGGSILLAYTTFKSFFPDLTPFGGSRRRSFPLANVIGESTSEYWTSLDDNDADIRAFKESLAGDEWVINTRLNAATGRNFSNWSEYQGPVTDNGDSFSLTERYDLANQVFDEAAFDEWIPMQYLANATERSDMQRNWNPEQIVLLTDGLCASACALFVEFMTRAGVRTVVAGGRPSDGPMQAVSGNRGATSYAATSLDVDMRYARSIDTYVEENANATIPEVREPGMYFRYASFNLRDQIRKDEKTPLQFKYEAADCRIYYTLANLYNMTQTWYDVAAAAFVDSSLCVKGSTGFSTTNNTSPTAPPPREAQRPILGLNVNNKAVKQLEWDDSPEEGLSSGIRTRVLGGSEILPCPQTGPCQDLSTHCRDISVHCSGEGKRNFRACLPQCVTWEPASCPGTCQLLQTQDAKVGLKGDVVYREQLHSGLCFPKVGTKKLGCKRDPSPQ
ncbi:peptidase S41 family protein [Cucurbitaria berberidis CBS 394.84]|uniref:Peptidase S41 family protein n=1 Tax=Cucurbitaria berberidis CBS 394.84 TaxID=1168544 RepID=A0A9P4G7Q5_9PLEO|nr:peptidase S41 family protein [Cucurbitaria berberidis CBS 394.84]KAF1840462.1 peptidase S41 family protein [Cucurbitaria berberidis CBS 394.84]